MMAATAEDAKSRITSIARAFDTRDQAAGDDATSAHSKWLLTPAGQTDAAFLAEHFEELSEEQKIEIPLELARTGRLATVPLLQKSLASSSIAVAGIFYAYTFGNPEPEFGKALAPAIAARVSKTSKKGEPTLDTALQILVRMDPELAAKELFVDEHLGINSPNVPQVLACCNQSGLIVPRKYLDPLLAAWEVSATKEDADYRIWKGYCEALKALSRLDRELAIQKAEAIMKQQAHLAETLAELPLLAAGLVRLYEKIADFADDPAKFKLLPEAARFYFAVTYFQADCDNGGITQALSNSTGDYLPLVRQAYQAIGAKVSLDWLDWMCRPFGKAGPSPDREIRNQQIEQMKPPYYDQEEALGEKWAKQHPEFHVGVMQWQLSLYVSKHAEQIIKVLDQFAKSK